MKQSRKQWERHSKRIDHPLPGSSDLGFFDNSTVNSASGDRKQAQLCEQIRRALDFAIPEALAETDFDGTVLEVKPAPNTSHLLVLIQPTEPLTFEECQKLQFEITRRSGMIRTNVAHSIHRRKTPTFTFLVSPS